MQEGYTRIVNELVEGLAQADLGPRHFRVLFAVIRQTYGWNKTRDRISGGQLAAMTGLKRQTCNRVVRELMTMNVIQKIDGAALRINTRSTTWDLDARPRYTHQGIPDTGTHGGSTPSEDQTGTHGDSTTGTHGGSATGTHGGTHKRQERQERQGQGKNPLSSADADPPSDDRASEQEKSPQREPVPYQAIVDAYHEILPELPQVQKLSKTRKTAIRARWNDTYGAQARPGNSIDFWRRYFWHVKRSRFLCGLKDQQDRPWRANLDFLFRESAMVQIIEGKYHQGDDYRELPGDKDSPEGGDDA